MNLDQAHITLKTCLFVYGQDELRWCSELNSCNNPASAETEPEQGTSVHWEAMCRGVGHCEGDHQVCGFDLKCPPRTYEGVLQIVTILNISSSLPCQHTKK